MFRTSTCEELPDFAASSLSCARGRCIVSSKHNSMGTAVEMRFTRFEFRPSSQPFQRPELVISFNRAAPDTAFEAGSRFRIIRLHKKSGYRYSF